jgi:hypothetical protein
MQAGRRFYESHEQESIMTLPQSQHMVVASHIIHQADSGDLFSLNDLHKASGGQPRHQPSRFFEQQSIKELIAELLTTGIPVVKSTEGRYGGTYACRELVIAYAAWISAAFHLRVLRVFIGHITGAAPQPVAVSLQDMRLLGRLGNARQCILRLEMRLLEAERDKKILRLALERVLDGGAA